jgi:hypothetical protein
VQVLQLAALQCLQQWYLRPLFNWCPQNQPTIPPLKSSRNPII